MRFSTIILLSIAAVASGIPAPPKMSLAPPEKGGHAGKERIEQQRQRRQEYEERRRAEEARAQGK